MPGDPDRLSYLTGAARLLPSAYQKAEDLLLSHLTESQRATYHKDGWFWVTGSAGRKYKIIASRRGSTTNNVMEYKVNVSWYRKHWWLKKIRREDYGSVASWCISPVKIMPPCDTFLAQKLLLETDEPEFRRIGIRTAHAYY